MKSVTVSSFFHGKATSARMAPAAGTGVLLFTNCYVLRNHEIVKEDFWVEDGKILDPEKLFFDRRQRPTKKIQCHGALIVAGLIDIQINGGFGADLSFDVVDKDTAAKAIYLVAKGILEHGVTSFCPTLVTSPSEVYHNVLPHIKRTPGGREGAGILGVHLEGPFISPLKKGAHPPEHILDLKDGGFSKLLTVYGSLDNVAILTMAPELDPEGEVVAELVKRGITVSVGHSMATLSQAERAVRHGATLITHLFNAMASFHHRDPGLMGLLTSEKVEGRKVYYGIIADGIHTHPAALRIAYRTNFESLCLVTDAICAMGLRDGNYTLGQMKIEVHGDKAVIAGTDTLCGASATLIRCVHKLIKEARCTEVEALEAATLHPAQALGIQDRKGTLDFGTDADFVMLDRESLQVRSTWIGGVCVYEA